MAATTTPALRLNNDVDMPALGLGVFQSPPEETVAAVAAALRAGYRHIDTAAAYGNEEAVGRAVRVSGIPRDELFITTKLWIQAPGEDNATRAFEQSLERLGLDYVDLYLIHALRRLLQLLACHREAPRQRADPGDRGVELLPGPLGRPHREQRRQACGQPDRDASLLPAPHRPGAHARPRRADGVVGTVRRGPQQPVLQPDARRHRRRTRQVGGPGRPAVAHPAQRRRHPKVRPCQPYGGEL